MNKKIIIMICAVASIFLTNKVYALEDTFYPDNWIPDIFIRSEEGSFVQNQQARITRRSSDGMFVYCIEHGANIVAGIPYVGSEEQLVSELNISKETLDKIKAIAYYGYGYDNHTDDKWFAITQVLIWKTMYPNMDIYYTDTYRGNRITKFVDEENELINLVNNHFIKPSFDGITKTVKKDDTIVLIDNNNVLKDYEIVNNDMLKVKKVDNKLEITPISDETTTLKLQKKTNKYNRPMIIWKNSTAQDFAMTGDFDTIEVNINIKSYTTEVEINKTGEDIVIENNSYKYQNVQLSDVVFNVYADEDIYDNDNLKYKKDQLVTVVTTDKKGKAQISNLYYGRYKLIEKKTSLNNELLKEPIFFTLTDRNNYITLNVDNKLKRYSLEINKIDSKTNEIIPNTEFELYLEDGTLIYRGKTDDCGKIVLDDLFIGKYYIKEVKAGVGYKLSDNPIHFEITNDTSETVRITVTNELIENVPYTSKNDYSCSVFTSVFIVSLGYYVFKIKK